MKAFSKHALRLLSLRLTLSGITVLFAAGCSTISAHRHCGSTAISFQRDWFDEHFRLCTNDTFMQMFVCDGRPDAIGLNSSRHGILLLHELPGMTPECLRLATNLAAHGYTVYLPLMFGKPNTHSSTPRMAWNFVHLSLSPRWHVYQIAHTSPIIKELRQLTWEISKRHDGKSVGVVGMCLTATLALALLSEESVHAAVLSQPATPFFRLTFKQRSALSLTPSDLAAVVRRTRCDGIDVLGLRFASDKLCQAQRFENLTYQLGTNFLDHTISLRECQDHGLPADAHSVLCGNYDDLPGHPTRLRFEQVLDYLDKRLKP